MILPNKKRAARSANSFNNMLTQKRFSRKFDPARNPDGRFTSKWGKLSVLGLFSLTVTATSVCWISGGESKVQPLISPVVERVKAAEPLATPTVSKHDVEYTFDQVADYIHYRESGKGKNNPIGSLANNCYTKGLTNEYGFGGMQNPKCFKSKDEARETVTKWITEKMGRFSNNIVTTLCFYRYGKVMNHCEYGDTFLKSVEAK